MRLLKSAAAPLILIVVGSLLALLLLEGLLRLVPDVLPPDVHAQLDLQQGRASDPFSFFQYDPRLGWRGVPQAQGLYRDQNVIHNALGFRDEARRIEKTSTMTRILIMGDSFTWGYGVAQEEAFPQMTQSLLSDQGKQVEVWNLGVNGFSTDQEYLLYQEEAVRFDADWVIVALYGNDPYGNVTANNYGYGKPRFEFDAGQLQFTNVPVPSQTGNLDRGGLQGGPGSGPVQRVRQWLSNRSILYAMVASKTPGLLRRLGLAQGPSPAVETMGALPPSGSEAWQMTVRILTTWAAEAEAEGSRLLVVLLPAKGESDPSKAEPDSASALQEALVNAASDLTVLDLTLFFQQARREGDEPLYFADDPHWTAAGHRLAARQLSEFLMTRVSP